RGSALRRAMTFKCRQIAIGRALSRLGRMARPAIRLAALGIAVAASLALASCGGSDAKLLPGAAAREITENLEAVRQLAAAGGCVPAEGAARQLSTQVEGLTGIDPKLQRNLEEGADRLNEVVAGCTEEPEEETVEEEEPSTAETTPKPAKKEPKPE